MVLKKLTRRFTTSVQELDRARLQERYCGLGVTQIADASCRVPVRLCGEVQKLQLVPRAGSPSLEVTVSDGTGKAVAIFTGRRRIAGLDPGQGILIEGVGRDERGRVVILNPAYTLL